MCNNSLKYPPKEKKSYIFSIFLINTKNINFIISYFFSIGIIKYKLLNGHSPKFLINRNKITNKNSALILTIMVACMFYNLDYFAQS